MDTNGGLYLCVNVLQSQFNPSCIVCCVDHLYAAFEFHEIQYSNIQKLVLNVGTWSIILGEERKLSESHRQICCHPQSSCYRDGSFATHDLHYLPFTVPYKCRKSHNIL